MTYPNAYSGVKKLFTAQILSLIVVILSLITAGIAAGGAAAIEDHAEAGLVALGGSAILGVIVLVIGVIALIITLVGLHQAGKDEKCFKTAFIFAIIQLVAAFVKGFGAEGSALYVGADFIADLAQIIMIIYVIYGVINLAKSLNDEKLAKRGKTLLTLIMILLIVALVISIVGNFVGGSETGAMIVGITGIVSAIIMLVAYIMYLTLLSRAMKTLKNN